MPTNKKSSNDFFYDTRSAEIFYEDQFDVKILQEFENIVWINGCFDLIHRGHLRTIRQSALSGDCLIVGINSDASVRNLKGLGRPINSEQERALTLAEIPGIKFIVIFSDNSPLNILKKIKPKLVFKDKLYEEIDYPEKKFLQEIGCVVTYLSHIDGISSTEIENRIKKSAHE
jgi:rfaE bifunctional protein nucleotidyltransferase chain/domain